MSSKPKVPTSSSSNGTSFPCKIKVEDKIVGSRPTRFGETEIARVNAKVWRKWVSVLHNALLPIHTERTVAQNAAHVFHT
jgi:hypothetical protein